MLNEVCGLFEDHSRNTEFYVNTERLYIHDEVQQEALTILRNAINKNKEVAGLLNLIDGDMWIKGKPYYSTKYIFSMLCFTKLLLDNLLWLVDNNIKKEGVLSKTIFNGVLSPGEVKKRIEKLPPGATAKDALNSGVKIGGVYFYNKIFARCRLHKIFIANDKIHRIIGVLEKVGSDDGTYEIIQNAIKEIDEVMNAMIDSNAIRYGSNGLTHHVCENEVGEEAKEAETMEDNPQTLSLNRPPKQQENKIITVGNKKAYQVGKGDYKHRNGVIIEKDGIVIKEEKAEMQTARDYHIEDKAVLADLEDLLNNVIDNPDTVDGIVDYLAKDAPAAHFISEMVGCDMIRGEETLLMMLNKAELLSKRIKNAGGAKNVHALNSCDNKILNYLSVDPKPVFGKEYYLDEFHSSFCHAQYDIKRIFDKAKEEEQEEKEEVIANDTVQEHAEEDCEPHTQDHRNYDELDFEELTKLVEERRKEVADLTVEVKQAEEEARRRELVNELIALDKQKAELNARKAELNKK